MAADGVRDVSQLIIDRALVAEALRHAARHALMRHKVAGVSMPVWTEGRTKLVPPEALEPLLAAVDEQRAEGPRPSQPNGRVE